MNRTLFKRPPVLIKHLFYVPKVTSYTGMTEEYVPSINVLFKGEVWETTLIHVLLKYMVICVFENHHQFQSSWKHNLFTLDMAKRFTFEY